MYLREEADAKKIVRMTSIRNILITAEKQAITGTHILK